MFAAFSGACLDFVHESTKVNEGEAGGGRRLLPPALLLMLFDSKPSGMCASDFRDLGSRRPFTRPRDSQVSWKPAIRATAVSVARMVVATGERIGCSVGVVGGLWLVDEAEGGLSTLSVRALGSSRLNLIFDGRVRMEDLAKSPLLAVVEGSLLVSSKD